MCGASAPPLNLTFIWLLIAMIMILSRFSQVSYSTTCEENLNDSVQIQLQDTSRVGVKPTLKCAQHVFEIISSFSVWILYHSYLNWYIYFQVSFLNIVSNNLWMVGESLPKSFIIIWGTLLWVEMSISILIGCPTSS